MTAAAKEAEAKADVEKANTSIAGAADAGPEADPKASAEAGAEAGAEAKNACP